MRLHYDAEVDALYLKIVDEKIIESEEVQPGIVLDYDERGNVVGIEVLGMRKRIPDDDLHSLQAALA
jgi:uncharacterized protein YuzE